MPRRHSGSGALIVTLCLGLVAALAPVAHAATVPPPPATVDTWAWCGVNPDDPAATTAVKSMAQAGGIDATFGPCNIPTSDYTPAHTANRYVSFDTYMRLVQLNATVGMKTVVYDDRFWSPDPLVRQTAIGYWTPVLANIAAWDMGDEFDPTKPEWDILKQRWAIMRSVIEPATGVKPFANFLPTSLNNALTDLPGVERLLSFTKYDGDKGVSVAQAFDSRAAKLMCGVNEIDHNGLFPTAKSIRTDMDALKAAGCDQILVFTGFPVYDNSNAFGPFSVVDRNGAPSNRAAATQEGSGHSSLIPVVPARLLETRSGPGLGTVDSQFNAIGIRPDDSVLELGVVGRASLPATPSTVVLNVTVTGASAPGFLTVYPCTESRPTSSNLNYDAGTTRAVAVVARVGSNGAVCIYNQASVHVIADLTGYYTVGASFSGMQPARLLDTRVGPELTTVDGQSAGIGRQAGGSTTEVKVAGRGGVPTDATSVAVNVTAINPKLAGFITVFPCGEAIPNASTVNFTPGAIVPNAAMVKIGADGSICVFSNTETDAVVDVNGYDASQSVVRLFDPLRVLETRPGLTTADGLAQSIGQRPSDSTLELNIGGRLGVPTAIHAAVLNITVTEATAAGFLTVYPCGSNRPVASTLNYGLGTTVANLAVAATSSDGRVCIYTQAATQLVVDLSGYHT